MKQMTEFRGSKLDCLLTYSTVRPFTFLGNNTSKLLTYQYSAGQQIVENFQKLAEP